MATAGKGRKLKGTGVRFSTEVTRGHPREVTLSHHPEGTRGQHQEGTRGHPQEGTRGHPQEGTRSHPPEGTRGHPQEGTHGHPPEGTRGHPPEGTRSQHEEGTHGHPPEVTRGHPPEGTHGHVHFQEQLHDPAVMVTQDKDGHFLVKVGFLRIQHKYEITFLLPPVPTLARDICPLPVPNPNLRIVSVTSLPEGHSVRCEYTASREGVLMEELLLAGHGPDRVKVTIQARVMDRHHGTPMLLDGVRCLAAELEYDSEQSDWPGFD